MDKNQINEQIEKLQVQLKMAIQATNFEQATEIKLLINRYKSILSTYRTNYDLEEHIPQSMSAEEINRRISSLNERIQGCLNSNDFEEAKKLSVDLKRYEEIIRLVNLDKSL